MIDTRFWDDNYIITLSPVEKLLFLYLITNPLTLICGVYEIAIRRIVFDTGISESEVLEKLEKFGRDGKIYYLSGWVYIKNFTKHQTTSESVQIGIKREMDGVPAEIVEKIKEIGDGGGTVYTRWVQRGGNLTKLNLTKPIGIAAKRRVRGFKQSDPQKEEFVLRNEIEKLKKNKQRHIQLIGEFMADKEVKLETWEQFEEARSRHLRAAVALAKFSDKQIYNASEQAKKEFPDIWTMETLVKILIK